MFLSLEMQTPRTPTRKVSGTADPAVWEATLAAALTPALSSAKPSEAFVAHLGRQLAREAQEQKTREQRLRVAGVVGGGPVPGRWARVLAAVVARSQAASAGRGQAGLELGVEAPFACAPHAVASIWLDLSGARIGV